MNGALAPERNENMTTTTKPLYPRLRAHLAAVRWIKRHGFRYAPEPYGACAGWWTISDGTMPLVSRPRLSEAVLALAHFTREGSWA